MLLNILGGFVFYDVRSFFQGIYFDIYCTGGWMQPCSECWVFNGWICNNTYHEKVEPHLGYSSNAH